RGRGRRHRGRRRRLGLRRGAPARSGLRGLRELLDVGADRLERPLDRLEALLEADRAADRGQAAIEAVDAVLDPLEALRYGPHTPREALDVRRRRQVEG